MYIFISLPRFISYVSDQCSSVSKDPLAAVTLKVGGIFCFLSSILRDPHFMWSHLTAAKSVLGKVVWYYQEIPTAPASLGLRSSKLPVGDRLLRQLLKPQYGMCARSYLAVKWCKLYSSVYVPSDSLIFSVPTRQNTGLQLLLRVFYDYPVPNSSSAGSLWQFPSGTQMHTK